MKKKTFLIIASFLMILIGILRGLGGLSLFLKGNTLETNQPIIANELQIKLVALGLVLICVLLIYSGINVVRKYSKRSWNVSLIALILFLFGGIMNGIILFGKPVVKGQMINIIAVIICSVFLILGKSAPGNQE
jgi:hypothetical protein